MWQVSSSKNVEFIQTPLGGIYEPSVEPSVQTLSYFPPSDALAASHKNAVHLRLDLKGNLRDRSEVCGEQRDHTIRVFRLTKPVAIAQNQFVFGSAKKRMAFMCAREKRVAYPA